MLHGCTVFFHRWNLLSAPSLPGSNAIYLFHARSSQSASACNLRRRAAPHRLHTHVLTAIFEACQGTALQMATLWSGGGVAQELDRYQDSHVQFWEAMAMVSEHELAESQRQEDIDRARLRGEEPSGAARHLDTGWHASIDADMSSMFAGPSRHRSSCFRSCFRIAFAGFFPGLEAFLVADLERERERCCYPHLATAMS